jgi:hypothetical protein
MPLTIVSGDPLLTRAQTLAFGANLKGRSEVGALKTQLLVRYPAAFSTYNKLCKSGRASAGTCWFWRESRPSLAFLIIRESAVGATRLRYVQAVTLALARDWRRLGIESLAIAPLGRETEWPEIRAILNSWFADSPVPVVVYAEYRAGVQADEGRL